MLTPCKPSKAGSCGIMTLMHVAIANAYTAASGIVLSIHSSLCTPITKIKPAKPRIIIIICGRCSRCSRHSKYSRYSSRYRVLTLTDNNMHNRRVVSC